VRLLFAILAVSLGLGAALGFAAARMEFAGFEERFEVRPPEYKSNPYRPELTYATDGEAVAVVEGGETYDFGVMSSDESRSHTFVIRNEGTAPMTIRLGQTSCKCTVSGLKKNELPPGDSAEIELKWTPKAVVTEFKQTAPVYTNDPNRSEITLTVQGAVLADAWISPSEMSLPDLNPAEDRTVTAFVWSLKDEPPVIMPEFVSERLKPYMTLETVPATAEEIAGQRGAKSGVKLLIGLKRGFPLGPFSQTLRVQTDPPLDIPMQMTMTGTFVGDLRVIGPAYDSERGLLDLGEIPSVSGKEAKLNLLLKGENAADVEVTFAPDESDPGEAFEVEFGEKRMLNEGAAMLPLTVRVKRGLPNLVRVGAETQPLGRLVLKTTHPDYPTLPIWVRFSVTTERP
jgi:hypothetical protein